MTMLEIYKQRKDALILRMKESKSLYETGTVINEALEVMQYQYLAQGDNDQLTDCLASLLTFTKSSVPLIESVNKYNLWESTDKINGQKEKSSLPGLVFLLAGLLLIFVPMAYHIFIYNLPMSEMQAYLGLMALGAFTILFSGFLLFHRKKRKQSPNVEIRVNREDLANRLEEVIKNIDKALEAEKLRLSQQKEMMDTRLNDEEIELFGHLMEAKIDGNIDFIYEQLGEVEGYLSKMDVLTISYAKGNEKYFEFLEGEEKKTIRPAMMRKGKIIAKGLRMVPKGEFAEE